MNRLTLGLDQSTALVSRLPVSAEKETVNESLGGSSDFEKMMMGVQKNVTHGARRKNLNHNDVEKELSPKPEHKAKDRVISNVKREHNRAEVQAVVLPEQSLDILQVQFRQALGTIGTSSNSVVSIVSENSELKVIDDAHVTEDNISSSHEHINALNSFVTKCSSDTQDKVLAREDLPQNLAHELSSSRLSPKDERMKIHSVSHEDLKVAQTANEQIPIEIHKTETHFKFEHSFTSSIATKIIQNLPNVTAEQPTALSKMSFEARPAKIKILHIKLHPESLGEVSIAMSLKGNTLELKIEASSRETAATLSNDQKMLETMVKSSGYEMLDQSIIISFKPDNLILNTFAGNTSQQQMQSLDQSQMQFSQMDFSGWRGGESAEDQGKKNGSALQISPESKSSKAAVERSLGAIYL